MDIHWDNINQEIVIIFSLISWNMALSPNLIILVLSIGLISGNVTKLGTIS